MESRDGTFRRDPRQPDYETPACFVADRAGAHPEFDFAWLRKESPEKYESYVDPEAGAWTKYRIVVDGTKARLFVHGAGQPCLIVDDGWGPAKITQ
jgi:hypothetical protein